MATDYSFLPWKISWTEEPGGLQSMGSPRVRHDSETKHTQRNIHKYAHTPKKKKSRLPGGSDGKASDYNAGDPGSIPGLGRFSGEGNSNALYYSCLENPMDGGVP